MNPCAPAISVCSNSAEYGGSTSTKILRVGDKGVTRAAFIWQPKHKAAIDCEAVARNAPARDRLSR
jgi:hypothetical protein